VLDNEEMLQVLLCNERRTIFETVKTLNKQWRWSAVETDVHGNVFAHLTSEKSELFVLRRSDGCHIFSEFPSRKLAPLGFINLDATIGETPPIEVVEFAIYNAEEVCK
jgi:hypothetical protein